MEPRTHDVTVRRVVVVVVVVVTILLAIAGGLLVEFNGGNFAESNTSGEAVFAVSFVVVGGVIVAGRRNTVGWVMLIAGFFFGLGAFVGDYSQTALEHGLPLRAATAWLSAWLWTGAAVFPLVLLLFPTGRPPSPRWWSVAMATIVASLAVAIENGAKAWGLVSLPVDEAALERLMQPRSLRVTQIALVVLASCLITSGASLVVRYRRGAQLERQQIKWLLVAGAVMTVVFFTVSPAAPVDLSKQIPLLGAISWLALPSIPAAIGIAILRYRLYDIDIVINRTLVYAVLTAILGAVYVGLVFAFQTVLEPFTADSDLAVATSTLAVAALFRPVRARVQSLIDRRFYRRKFDAQRTLETFSGELRDEVDLSELSSRLTDVVSDTMQPAHVSLWLRAGKAPS